jgi:hypothetical protein
MPGTSLATYLNDHLAGSVAALDLLDNLLEHNPAAGRDTLVEVRSEIQQDQQVLRDILDRFGSRESTARKVAAWLSEKLGQAKLSLDDSGAGDLRALEALEALGLGIQGKLSLWRALAAVAGRIPALGSLDFPDLQRRAERQFERVEELRLRAAQVALGP